MAGRDTVIQIDTTHLQPQDETRYEKVTAYSAEEADVPGTPDTVCSPVLPWSRRLVGEFDYVDDEDDQLTPTGRALYRALENPVLRYAVYMFPVAALLAIPLIVFATKYRGDDRFEVDGMSVAGILVYVEVLWFSFWMAKLIAAALPPLVQGLCRIVSTGVWKYAQILKATHISLSLFIWSILAICWFPLIHKLDDDYFHRKRNSDVPWITGLNKGLRASIASAAVLFGQKILMQLISINYHSTQHRLRIKDIQAITRAIDLLYEASLYRFPDRSEETLADDLDIHDTTNMQKFLKTNDADRWILRVFGRVQSGGQKLVSAIGHVARDMTGTQVMKPSATHAVVDAALERTAGAEALARRIFKCLTFEGRKAICPNVLIEVFGFGADKEAAWIFSQLDRDKNGSVSMEEMMMLVTSISQQRKDMGKSACNIRDAIQTLDRVLTVVVLAIVITIYSAFFSNFVMDNLRTIITLLSASAFSFGQTVGEFNAACIQVFVKHPFDVGDRINMTGQEFEVVRISLLYTVFRRIETDTIVQVANSVVGALFIDNVSRSDAMRERYQFAVDPTTSFHSLELLRLELDDFVKTPENCRDFQQDVDIQLVSLADLKQLDLRVEIKHKSNWANDQLRAYRRSKFLCALLSATRKVPIYSPAGGGPDRGTIEAPNYNVPISIEAAQQARQKWDRDKETDRLKRPVHDPVPVPDVPLSQASTVDSCGSGDGAAMSTGLDILPSLRGGFLNEEEGFLSRSAAYLRHGAQRSNTRHGVLSSRPGSRAASRVSSRRSSMTMTSTLTSTSAARPTSWLLR